MSEVRFSSARRCAAATLLALATVLAYAPVRDHPYLFYDDDLYVTQNPVVLEGLTLPGVRWAFAEAHAGNWHPLTWLSHMLDVEQFGVEARGPHLVNLALHVGNALLLLHLLESLTGAPGRSTLVAAFFALHPLHVESVAWIAERKDLLSTLFGFLSIAAWARGVRRDSRPWRGAAIALHAASLLCKPMWVTLPFLLLGLDYWPLRRLRGARDLGPLVREKLPFLLLALASSAATLAAQSSGVQSGVPWSLRLSNALVSCARYLGKTLWPVDLAVLYPRPTAWGVPAVAGAALLLAALGAAAILLRRRQPWLLVGGLWFLVMLAPTLGLVPVGIQAMADRYTYAPLVGVLVAAVWSAGALLDRSAAGRRLGVAAALVALAGSALGTRAQLHHWRDTLPLFERALAVTDDNFFAHTEVGIALAARGRHSRAVRHFREALRIHPGFARAHANLGASLLALGDVRGAVAHLRRSLEIDPALRGAPFALALALERAGLVDEAILRHREQLRLDPQHRGSALRLAALLAERSPAEALRLLEALCPRTRCDDPEALDAYERVLQ